MRSKLFKERAKTIEINTGRWLRILPDESAGYAVADLQREEVIGRVLFDTDDNWVYDGRLLSVSEQEAVAGLIGGHQREMDELIKGL